MCYVTLHTRDYHAWLLSHSDILNIIQHSGFAVQAPSFHSVA